jgi:hypothetical protein
MQGRCYRIRGKPWDDKNSLALISQQLNEASYLSNRPRKLKNWLTRSSLRDLVVTGLRQTIYFDPSNTTSFRLPTDRLVLRRIGIGERVLLFAEGRIGGTPGTRSHTFIHVATTIFLLSLLFSKQRLKRKDFQEITRLAWAQEVPSSNLGAPTTELKFHRVIEVLLEQSCAADSRSANRS